MKVPSRILMPLLGIMLAACGTADLDQGATAPDETITTTVTTVTTTTTVPGLSNPPDKVTTTTIMAVTGEVPNDILERILEDATGRSDVELEDLSVVRAQAMEWPDGALGCPEPGQFYTQALVSGYWVEVEAPDATYDYRVDGQGNFKLCENEILPPSQGGYVTPNTTGSDS